jgi:ribosome assembly protein YihI (activator of Der GTPase)
MSDVRMITPLDILDRELERLHKTYQIAIGEESWMVEKILDRITKLQDSLLNPTFIINEVRDANRNI